MTNINRKCYSCKKVKLLDNFRKDKTRTFGYSYLCKECDDNKKKIRDKNKQVKLLQIREKLVGRKKPKQCEICGAIGKICYDHNHKTGKFRGWICYRCNLTLGFVKDNTELLNVMIEYLKNNK